jgi:hypothetical protein
MQYNEQVEQQMFAMILSWQQSGLSQKVYCEQHSIRYHVFHYWYKRYRDGQTMDKEPGFISLKIKPSYDCAAPHAELLLPDGKRLLFHQPVSSDYLKAIIS